MSGSEKEDYYRRLKRNIFDSGFHRTLQLTDAASSDEEANRDRLIWRDKLSKDQRYRIKRKIINLGLLHGDDDGRGERNGGATDGQAPLHRPEHPSDSRKKGTQDSNTGPERNTGEGRKEQANWETAQEENTAEESTHVEDWHTAEEQPNCLDADEERRRAILDERKRRKTKRDRDRRRLERLHRHEIIATDPLRRVGLRKRKEETFRYKGTCKIFRSTSWLIDLVQLLFYGTH